MKKFYAIVLAIGFLTMGALEANGAAATESPIAPYFTTRPKDCTVSTGVTVHFICQVEGRPSPQIEVFKNGSKIVSGDKYEISYKYGKVTLIIKDVQTSDAGEYEFKATNSAGTASVRVKLNVIDPDKDNQ